MSSHTSGTGSPRARKALARAAQQGPVTQGYLANATAERIPILFMNLAFAALDAAVPQLHTEVSCTSWLQLLRSRTLVESRHHLSTRPSSPRAITWLLCSCSDHVTCDQNQGESTKEPKQTGCYERPGLVMNDPISL